MYQHVRAGVPLILRDTLPDEGGARRDLGGDRRRGGGRARAGRGARSRAHVDERQLLSELAAALQAIASGESTSDGAARRAAALLRHHVGAHIEKENELIVPWVETLFSPAEQGQIMGAVVSAFSPSQMARVVPWIVHRLGDDMAVAYVTGLSKAMPPPVFEAARGWLRDGCGAERVALLRARIPGFE